MLFVEHLSGQHRTLEVVCGDIGTVWGFFPSLSDPVSPGSLCDVPLPNPEMSFHVWTEEEDLCELACFQTVFIISYRFSILSVSCFGPPPGLRLIYRKFI